MKSIYKIASKFEKILKHSELTEGLKETKVRLSDEQDELNQELKQINDYLLKIRTEISNKTWEIENLETMIMAGKSSAKQELRDLEVALGNYQSTEKANSTITKKILFLRENLQKPIENLLKQKENLKSQVTDLRTELGYVKLQQAKIVEKIKEIDIQYQGIDSVETRGWLSD